MALLNDDEFVEIEGRQYLRPEIALNEANTFIDNLRNSQQANNQQIQMQTYNLGTEVPSNLGGLTGGNSYFTSRYQVPQTASAVADLRATAQAAALNQVLQNEQDIWKKRYNDAYRAYQKSAYNKSGGSGGGSNGETGDNTSSWNGEIEEEVTDEEITDEDGNSSTVPPNPDDYYVTGEEQTKNIQERSGLPDWLVNIMKIFGRNE